MDMYDDFKNNHKNKKCWTPIIIRGHIACKTKLCSTCVYHLEEPDRIICGKDKY